LAAPGSSPERLHRDPKSERPEEHVVAVHASVDAPQNGDSPFRIAETVE